MFNLLRTDFYRFGKNKLLYVAIIITIMIAFSLTILIQQDIRLGISVFGNLMALNEINDILRMGIQYSNGLGIFIAILLSGFIGQEYQWKTWQYKWLIKKSRSRIYLSKLILSMVGSSLIFFTYVIIVLLSSPGLGVLFKSHYFLMLISGLSIYAALGAVICLFSMLIKNNIASIVICLCYVLFAETLVSLVSHLMNISESFGRIIEFGIKHSIYGMSIRASSMIFSPDFVGLIILNSFAIIILSTIFGIMAFKKYE